MTDKRDSKACFEEIKAYSAQQVTMLAIKGLSHAEKQCVELLTNSSDVDAKNAADLARQYLADNRQKLVKRLTAGFTQTLLGEKVIDDESSASALSLSLVDDDMLDEMIIIGELTGRIQDHYDLHLKAIKRGLVRLTKEMDFEPEPEALTPKKIVLLLHEPLGESELKMDSKRLIYRAFTDAAQVELKPLYDGVLALMQESGTITESENPASQNFKVIYQYRQQQGGGVGGRAPAAPQTPTAAPDPSGSMPMQPMHSMQPLTGHMPMSVMAPANLAPVSASQAMNPALFQGSAVSEAVYGFLSRAPQVQTDTTGAPLPTVDSGDLLKLLSSLQNLNTMALAQSALRDPTSISQHINEAITEKTSEWSKQLSGPEANVIELVNKMFITILEDPDLIDPVKVQIGRLQIPYIKVALLDVTLLNQAAHPARLLLNELAQIGVRVNSPGDSLMKLIQTITRNILDKFETDLNVFANNLLLLRKESESKAKEAAEAEEETRDKAESQAKLLHVKKHIVIRLRQYLKGKILPKEVHALLLKGFAPLLLTIYRKQGEDSEQWNKTIYLLRQTVESVQPRESAYQLDAVIDRSAEIIEQVTAAFAELPKKLFDGSIIEGLKSAYENLAKKLGHLQTKKEPEADEVKYDPLELDKDYQPEPDPALVNQPTPQEILAQMPEQLRAGAWCEVYIGRNEAPKKLKVSSILRDTAQIVFVDSSGEESEIKDLRDFLDELDCERSRIIQDEQLFDKALTAVINNMNLMRATA